MEIDPILYKKMFFIYNSLNKGWTVSKTGEIITLSKKHQNKRKYFKKKVPTYIPAKTFWERKVSEGNIK